MAGPPAPAERQRESAVDVVRRLREAGHEAYFVGGCVREMLLGHEPQDYDVTTDAPPDRVCDLFERTVRVGARFGVVTVVDRGVHVEVATFRTEGGYVDGRRPGHVAYSGAAEDVARRDLTVNALLYDPVEDRVIDHVGGRQDLADGLIRTVGDPQARFAEDHLRLLRAVRFAARLDFRIEEATARALRAHAPLITRISAERVRDELDRMLAHPSRERAVRMLDELGLLQHVLPEVAATRGTPQPPEHHPEGDVLTHVKIAMGKLPAGASPDAAWGTLLHDIGKPGTLTREEGRIRFHGHEVLGAELADGLLRRLRFANDRRDRIVTLVRRHLQLRDAPRMRRATLRRLLAEPWIEDLVVLARADAQAGSGDVAHVEFTERARAEEGPRLPDPLVTGEDLRQEGLPPGPEYGRLLAMLRDEQLEGRLSDRAAALERIRQLVRERG